MLNRLALLLLATPALGQDLLVPDQVNGSIHRISGSTGAVVEEDFIRPWNMGWAQAFFPLEALAVPGEVWIANLDTPDILRATADGSALLPALSTAPAGPVALAYSAGLVWVLLDMDPNPNQAAVNTLRAYRLNGTLQSQVTLPTADNANDVTAFEGGLLITYPQADRIDLHDGVTGAFQSTFLQGTPVNDVSFPLTITVGTERPFLALAARTWNGSQPAVMELDRTGAVVASWVDPASIGLNSGWFLDSGDILMSGSPLLILNPGGGFTQGGPQGVAGATIASELPLAGTVTCSSTPNSTGETADLYALGSPSLSTNDLTLFTDELPLGQFGVHFMGMGMISAPFGNGFLCVTQGGSPLIRLSPLAANAQGHMVRALDLAAAPLAGAVTSGTTWSMQTWFRDPAAGGAAFDTSSGVRVTFVP